MQIFATALTNVPTLSFFRDGQYLAKEVNFVLLPYYAELIATIEKEMYAAIADTITPDEHPKWRQIAHDMILELVNRERNIYLDLVEFFFSAAKAASNSRLVYEDGMQAILPVCREGMYLIRMMGETFERKLTQAAMPELTYDFAENRFELLHWMDGNREYTEDELRTINADTDELMAIESIKFYSYEMFVREKFDWFALFEKANNAMNAVENDNAKLLSNEIWSEYKVQLAEFHAKNPFHALTDGDSTGPIYKFELDRWSIAPASSFYQKDKENVKYWWDD